jgi:hypothetical protein
MALELRPYRPGDEAALLAARPECAALGADAWRWCCAENPAGRRVILALDGARAVGHYAAVPRKVWIPTGETVFAEVLGSFALGPASGGLRRDSLYARLGRALAEAHAGPGGDLVYHGLLQEAGAEWRVANGLLDCEVVRKVGVLARAPGAGPSALPEGVERLERFDHQARWLWDRIAGTFGAGAIRDDVYLNWRFRARPGVRYELLGVRDAGGILRGCAVLRAGELAGRRAAWLVDWIVPSEEREVGQRLLSAALALARSAGEGELAAVLPEWSPWFEELQRAGFLVHPSPAFLYCRSFARKFDEIWLRDHWWFTLADALVL